MAWVKKDDKYPVNKKIRRISDAAYRLDDSAMCWSAETGSDGHIPTVELPNVSEVKKPAVAAEELVQRGRWHTPGHDCKSKWCRPIEEGWLIHDFLHYNPSAAHVAEVRKIRADAGRNGGRKPKALRVVGDEQ